MARFRLRQAPFGPRYALVDLCGGSADLLVGFLEEFRERQLYMGRDPIDFRLALGLDFFKEGRQCVCVQPGCGLREGRHWWQIRGYGSWRTVPEQARFLQVDITVCRKFQRIEPFVDHVAQAIYHTRPVEVQTRWGMVL
jgi:hypothetical protein